MARNDKPVNRPRKSAEKRTHKGPGRASTKSEPKPPREVEPPQPQVVAGGAQEGDSATSTPALDFPVVGIGASAGGLAAFETFFSALPKEDMGMAFVLVQHLAPDHKSILHEIVGRYTRMEVHEATDGVKVGPNCTYIIPPNKDMALVGGELRLTSPTTVRGNLRLPIDFFFRSLAREQGERAICVVLSGTGSDGTLGVRAIKGEGGMAMAQAPDTTEHDGMPRSAIATGLVDYVLPPSEMPVQLLAYVHHAFSRARKRPVPPPKVEGTLKNLCVLLRAQTGHDFSQYKETTLLRRMERRMALCQIEDPEAYLQFLRENDAEIEGLFRDLLIGVTNFFRDAAAYQALEEKIIPKLLDHMPADETIRVWVCGCSTGEEAYSVAILLQERIDALKCSARVQVFATDIDREAIEHARAGVYPASIAADMTPERLARYFTFDQDSGTYRVHKVLRNLLVFSEQDVVRDPPFSTLDLVSCRNLLIYLKPELQNRLMRLFHYALRPGGALFLGNSETVGDLSRQFSIVDRKWKLYLRQPQEIAGPPPVHEFGSTLHERIGRERAHVTEPGERRNDLRAITEQALLAHNAQAGLLLNRRGDVLHIVGRTGKFLEPASGDAVMNIVSMAREGLQRPLSIALHRVTTHKKMTQQRGIRVRANGGHINVNLTLRPAGAGDGANTDMFLAVIEEAAEPADQTGPEDVAASADGGESIAALEQELRAKEEYLQTTLEEMETTNEELKSTNEEMQSVNEELQSTNEELETSKEELQSVNEELSTVNAELQDKVADLSRANNDMNNLLAGTGVGTLFIDLQLRIARFTPVTTEVINLIHHDVGRPVEHVVTNLLNYRTLTEDARAVLNTLAPKEIEVQTRTGAWYLMRIRPYRTIENVIEGVVVTFFDVTERKRAEVALRKAEARFEAIFHQAFVGIAQLDLDGRLLLVNDQYCRALGYERDELQALTFRDITHREDWANNKELFDQLIKGGSDFTIERRLIRKDGAHVRARDRVAGIRDSTGKVESIVTISVLQGSDDGHRG
jgi:two-component system CheB/CheR fusion protein